MHDARRRRPRSPLGQLLRLHPTLTGLVTVHVGDVDYTARGPGSRKLEFTMTPEEWAMYVRVSKYVVRLKERLGIA